MAKGKNSVFLLGHTGKEIEYRVTDSGVAIANVSLATTEYFKNQHGERVERTEWHNLVAFHKLAEVFRDYVHKGSRIDVVGRLQTRTWDDKDTGVKRYRTEIIVKEIILLDGKRNSDGTSQDEEYGEHTESMADVPF